MEAISGIVKVAQPLIQGFGLVSNLIQGHKQSQIQQNAINAQNQLGQLIADPATLAARIQQLEQPLSQGYQRGVGNEVQGYLMERGLGLSPSVQSQIMAQALGPAQLQQQALAQQAFFAPYQEMGYLTNAAQHSGPGIGDTSGFWNSLNTLTSLPRAGQPQISPSGNLPGQAYPQQIPRPPGVAVDPTAPDIQFPGTQLPDYGTIFPDTSGGG